MKQLIYGTAYDGLFAPDEQLDRDFTLMAQANMNTILVGARAWRVWEPKTDAFDFAPLIRIIQEAGKHDLNVLVTLPVCQIPGWLREEEPGILVTEPGASPALDLTNPVYLRCAERLIRKLVARTATFPGVVGYAPDRGCGSFASCGERILSGFRDWLKGRFAVIEELNEAYGLSLDGCGAESFDTLPEPRETESPGYAAAFAAYRGALTAQFLRWQEEIAGAYKRPDQLLLRSFSAGPGTSPDESALLPAGMLPAAVGMGGRPAGPVMSLRDAAFAGDLLRAASPEGYCVLDLEPQGPAAGRLPTPGQTLQLGLAQFAFGCQGLIYRHWSPVRCGANSGERGVLDQGGTAGNAYREAQTLGAALHRITPEVCGMQQETKVALVVSSAARTVLNRLPGESGTGYDDILRSIHAALFALNLPCDILPDSAADRLFSDYSLLIFPQLFGCSDEFTARLRTYINDGGTVLATFRSFAADEHMRLREEPRPCGLADIFGMHAARGTLSEDGVLMELLETDRAVAAGRYEDPWWRNAAAATRCRFGKGHAWYLGTRLEPEDLKDFLMRVCEAAEIRLPGLRWPIVCRRAMGADGKELCFLLNASGEDQRLIKCPAAGRDLLSGERYAAGREMGLEECGAAILHEETDS